MKDLAILVDNKNDSTEAQDLLFSMGYKWRGLGENSKSYFYPRMNKYFIFMNKNEMDLQMAGYFAGSSRSYAESRFKEITLPELRDLVVLKRNDVGGAQYVDISGFKIYIDSDSKVYFFEHRQFNNGQYETWVESVINNHGLESLKDEYISELKPIEKTMKEYLRKNSDGTYSYIGTVRPEYVSDFMIEIPEGATKLVSHNYVHLPIMFVKPCANGYSYCYPKENWSDNILSNIKGRDILWSRHTHPEELPFIDDEPLQSLNDQYAEIEKVRQSAWQKQEGGSHYKNLKIQPMQYALENKLDYAQANVVKYVTRHKEKNGKEDLLKAIHNIELMIEFYYGGEK